MTGSSQSEQLTCYVCDENCVFKDDKVLLFGCCCDSCGRPICKACCGIKTSTEIRAILLQKQNRASLLWCPSCKEQNLLKIQSSTSATALKPVSPTPCTTLKTGASPSASEVENTYLKLLNKEMDDKNNILKSNNHLLEQQIKTLETELQAAKDNRASTNSTRGPEPSQHQSIERLFEEYKERENRKHNFIFFNCPESTTNVKEIATRLVNQCLTDQGSQIRETDLQAFRLGRAVTDKNRPVRVICNTSQIAYEVIRNSRKIKDIPDLSHLSISDDKTPQQIRDYRKLKHEMEERTSAGEKNLKIIYNNGVPKIIINNRPNRQNLN